MKEPNKTIDDILGGFDEMFTYLGGKHWIMKLDEDGKQISDILFSPAEVKQYIRKEIEELSDWLRMEKYEEDDDLFMAGWDDAVKEFNKKLAQARGEGLRKWEEEYWENELKQTQEKEDGK